MSKSGDIIHWRPPLQILGGRVPPSPQGLRLCKSGRIPRNLCTTGHQHAVATHSDMSPANKGLTVPPHQLHAARVIYQLSCDGYDYDIRLRFEFDAILGSSKARLWLVTPA